jgi:signal transduction histidine kinase
MLTGTWRELRHLSWGDLALAAVLIVLLDRPPYFPLGIFGGYWWALYGVVAGASVAWRRVRPTTVWAIATVATTLTLLPAPGASTGDGLRLPFELGAGPFTGVFQFALISLPLIGLYSLAAYTSRRRSIPALAATVIAVVGALAWSIHPVTTPATVANGLLLVAVTLLIGMAWVLGESTRTRLQAATALRERAAALEERAAALEAERAERDLRAAAEERSRIARDLHDIVAHHISVIALQAGTARLLAESGEPPATDLLGGIETTSRQAMTELRQAIGVIRHTEEGAAPLPGLGRLPELAFRIKEAGLTVVVEGSGGDLPGGLDLAAYRVVQEGLTNVVRHSQARTATVSLHRDQNTLEIVVTDDGPARAGDTLAGGGHGLIGLGERVRGYGGQLSTRMRPDGGFELRAELPTEQPTEQPEHPGPGFPGAEAVTGGPDLDRTEIAGDDPA